MYYVIYHVVYSPIKLSTDQVLCVTHKRSVQSSGLPHLHLLFHDICMKRAVIIKVNLDPIVLCIHIFINT